MLSESSGIKIKAHTLPSENPSVKVLHKCGFQFISEVIDPEDGLIWKWELRRELLCTPKQVCAKESDLSGNEKLFAPDSPF